MLPKKTNNNLIKLCRLLSDLEYHSGTEIGSLLDISRAAVGKMIAKLKQYGIKINCAKAKGYAFSAPLLLLDPEVIKARLKTEVRLEVFEVIDSTNDYLRRLSKSIPISVCISEQQNRGRGRFERNWQSPFGQNIYLSLRYPVSENLGQLGGLSLALGIIVCETLESCCQLPGPLSLKWPNDIFYKGQKIVGILVDVEAEVNGDCDIVVGVGLNINMTPDQATQISKAWTTINQITGDYQDRSPLCAALIDAILAGIIQYQDHGFAYFLKRWKMRDCLFGQQLNLQVGQQVVTGIATGVNEQGHLLLKKADGSNQAFASGDATTQICNA